MGELGAQLRFGQTGDHFSVGRSRARGITGEGEVLGRDFPVSLRGRVETLAGVPIAPSDARMGLEQNQGGLVLWCHRFY